MGANGFLTNREIEVVQLIAEGHSSKSIALALGISVKTADTHRTNIERTRLKLRLPASLPS